MSVETVVQQMEDLAEKDTVPSNVEESLKQAAGVLEDEEEELSIRINSASSILDRISNDPNIKQHTRTEIWNLASRVENLNN